MCLIQDDGGSTSRRLRRFNIKKLVKEFKLDIIVINIERIAFML